MRKYSAILGNLGNTRDRFCAGYKNNPSQKEMLRKAAAIDGIKGIELVGTWDISAKNSKGMKKSLTESGLECVSIIPDLFSLKEWGCGSISAKSAKTRAAAMDYLRSMCEISQFMECEIVNIWPGQDGYDYIFQGNYLEERSWLTENIAVIASEFPSLKFALEYKPQEPRTHSYMARMGDTLLVCLKSGMSNVGVTIDTGHAFMAGENVAESVVLAKEAGNRLFHMHFNDNFRRWDDDMIVGSIHSIEYVELLYWLDECGYDGWFSMDQYPYREDAAGAIGESMKWLKAFDSIMSDSRNAIKKAISDGDAVASSSLLRKIMLKQFRTVR